MLPDHGPGGGGGAAPLLAELEDACNWEPLFETLSTIVELAFHIFIIVEVNLHLFHKNH